MFRRLPDARRSIHIFNSVAALGPDAEYLTGDHHLGKYPWGENSPYARLQQTRGLMVGLGIIPFGFTPLHNVECVLHRDVPAFKDVFRLDEIAYSWRRRSGETGTSTTLVRQGRHWPGRLIRHLPAGVLKQFRLSNLTLKSAPADAAIENTKILALRNKTSYCFWGV
jgi:aminoglycoside 3-N-acetyltransferase